MNRKRLPMGLVNQNKSVEKSMAKVCILDILNSANAESPLTQVEIQRKLSDLYGIDLNRKTVGNHLKQLISNIDSIKYRTEDRTTKAESTDKFTDFYIEEDSEFEDSEILALIYSVIFSRHMPTKSKTDLVKKLEALTPTNMKKTLKNYLSGDVASRKVRNQLFWNLDQLSEAIESKKRVAFDYTTYVVGNGLEKRVAALKVSPLSLGIYNSNLYLVCFEPIGEVDGEDIYKSLIPVLKETGARKQKMILAYRLDRISNIRILEKSRGTLNSNSPRKIKCASDDNFLIQEFIEQNPNLELGPTVRATFLVNASGCEVADELIDLFGKVQVDGKINRFSREGKETCKVTVNGNKTTIRDFALRNGDKIELLQPESLRKELLETFEAAAKKLRGESS